MALSDTVTYLVPDFTPLLNISDDESDDEHQKSKEPWDILQGELESGQWDFGTIEGETPEGLRKRQDEREAEFFKQHDGTLETTSSTSNIFHYLAKSGEKKMAKLKFLVYLIVRRHRDLLITPKDPQGLTGFQAAIQAKNHKLVRYVLESYTPSHNPTGANVDEVLRETQDGSGNNALHLAMSYMTPIPEKAGSWLKAIEELIKVASPGTLSKLNHRGLTPLHIAVHGEKCTPQQFNIVKRLVEKCDVALDAALDTKTGRSTGPSPYQYEWATYVEWQKRSSQQQKQQRAPPFSNRKLNLKLHEGAHGRTNTAAEEAQAPDVKLKTLPQEKPRDGMDRIYAAPTQKISTGDWSLNAVGPGEENMDFAPALTVIGGPGSNARRLTRQPTMNRDARGFEDDTPPRSPSVIKFSSKTIKQQEKSKPKSETVTPESVEMIASYLKLVYLRKESRLRALNFLYGGITDKQLEFNLWGKEGEISEDDFKRGYECAKLEDILQSVYIPNLTIKPRPAGKKSQGQGLQSQSSSPEEVGVGRTDFKIIFTWLQKEAKVKKIIKLKVDDSRDPPHQDMAIEDAVAPFDVEVLDWVKVDLCGETIAKTAPNARHLKLYWSGKNAVLRGWSDSEGGLVGLSSLEQIDVFLQSDIEGKTRSGHNFAAFEQRFKRHVALNRQQGTTRKDIKIDLHHDGYNLNKSVAPPTKADAIQNHRWLKCMEKFSEFMINVRTEESLTPIKIAIIDDGIDTTKSRFHGRVTGGQSFGDQVDESPSFCVSARGHGTMMAHQVTRIVPGAKIISLKLSEYSQSDGSQFKVQSAADAVRYACEQGVDVINMSWSIGETAANEKALKSLSDAINLAQQRNILMFCSASDQGTTEAKSFPGTWWSNDGTLVRIGAATSTGKACSYVSQGNVDFIFPGRVVEQEQDDYETDNSTVARPRNRSTEGSSLATAFASGLAGLILYILQILKRCQDEEDMLSSEVKDAFDNIKNKPSRMKDAFKRIQTAEKFVEVWQVFDTSKYPKPRTQADRVKILAKIHSDLLVGLR